MNNFNLLNLIRQAKENETIMYELILRFTPLLKKYARFLEYEDAFFELQAHFIELMHCLNLENLSNVSDGALVNYIQKSIYNKYLKLSKNKKTYQNKFTLMTYDEDDLKNLLSIKDSYQTLEEEDLRKALTSYEYQIIVLIFYHGYTVKEIASSLKVSVQSVNQCKLRALSKLKRNL